MTVTHVLAPTKTTAQVFTAWDTNVTHGMWTGQASTVNVIQVDVLPLDGTSPTTVNPIAATPARWQGNGGASQTLPAVSNIIKIPTTLRGPAHRGRMFLPYMSEQEAQNGQFVPADLAVMQTAWNTFFAAQTASGLAMGVASYAHGIFTPATKLVCEALLATQKRRQDRLRRAV